VNDETPRALIARAPNEHHEVGPRMLVDALEADGWQVEFCGVTATMQDVLTAVREGRPRFIGISCSLGRHLDGVRDMITEIREELGDGTPPIVVGGTAFEGGEGLWQDVGADLFVSRESDPVGELRRFKG
jgi:MerR family transcriptional regulator, light-induced transcriptional regulator